MHTDNSRLPLFLLGFSSALLVILLYRQEVNAMMSEARYLSLVDELAKLEPTPAVHKTPGKNTKTALTETNQPA